MMLPSSVPRAPRPLWRLITQLLAQGLALLRRQLPRSRVWRWLTLRLQSLAQFGPPLLTRHQWLSRALVRARLLRHGSARKEQATT